MTQKWEAKWYVQSALRYMYKVKFIEVNTPWARNPRKLAQKTLHGVSEEKIKEMLALWEDDFPIPNIINCKIRNQKKKHCRRNIN